MDASAKNRFKTAHGRLPPLTLQKPVLTRSGQGPVPQGLATATVPGLKISVQDFYGWLSHGINAGAGFGWLTAHAEAVDRIARGESLAAPGCRERIGGHGVSILINE